MNNKPIKRLLTIFFTVNMALLGAYAYLLYAVQTKNKESSALYTLSHDQILDKGKIQELERALKETEKERGKFYEYFMNATNAVAFIEQIEKLGKSASVSLSVSSVSDGIKEDGTIQLGFSATGSFVNLYRLMALVESLPYKITLKKVDFQKSDGGEEGADWKGNFMVILESFTPTNPAVAAIVPVKK